MEEATKGPLMEEATKVVVPRFEDFFAKALNPSPEVMWTNEESPARKRSFTAVDFFKREQGPSMSPFGKMSSQFDKFFVGSPDTPLEFSREEEDCPLSSPCAGRDRGLSTASIVVDEGEMLFFGDVSTSRDAVDDFDDELTDDENICEVFSSGSKSPPNIKVQHRLAKRPRPRCTESWCDRQKRIYDSVLNAPL